MTEVGSLLARWVERRASAPAAVQRAACRSDTAAAGFGGDAFAPSPALVKAVPPGVGPPPVDTRAAIQTAEQPFAPQLLDTLPAVLDAPDARGERQLAAAYGRMAGQTAARVPTSIDKAVGDRTVFNTPGAWGTPEITQANPRLATYLQGILDRLCQAAGVAPYQLHLYDGDVANAFSPGGPSMQVFKGILPLMSNEAELAGVLAHELTHGVLRHKLQQTVNKDAAKAAAGWLDKALPANAEDRATAGRMISQLGPVQQQDPKAIARALQGRVGPEEVARRRFQANSGLAMLALARADERAADAGAVRLLSQAGYDPHAMLTAFAKLPEDPNPVRFANHPTNAQRIAALEAQIAREHLAVGPMETNESAYQQAIAAT